MGVKMDDACRIDAAEVAELLISYFYSELKVEYG